MSINRFWNLIGKKLAGEALPEELEEINELLKAHPEWLYSSEQIAKYWKNNKNNHEDYDAELAFEIHLAKLKDAGVELPALESAASDSDFIIQEKKQINYKKTLLFIVLLFMVTASGIIWYNYTGKRKVQEVPSNNFSEVSTKQRSSKLVLPDSTIVWLNSGSTLTYSENFGTINRNTKLEGEAFFEVKESTIPFLIQANGVQIKVLGTAFNVKSYPEEKTTETSLIRGKIEITLDQRPGEKFLLNPNEKLIVSTEPELKKLQRRSKTEPIVVLSGLTFTTDNTIIETSWMQNKLVFQDESFSDLTKTMERWYGVNIDIQNEKLKAERFTGTFTTETIQEALEGLQMSTPFRFTIKLNSIVITR
ncbi:MAG: FecR family protein [Flavisolibacter sp.]